MTDEANDRERALTAGKEEISLLLHHHSPEVLHALLDNAALDESHLCLLLERKDLPGEFLEEIGKRRAFLKSYRVKRGLAFHPHTPRLISLRLIRELYLMDLVQLTLQPGTPVELKLQAEEQLVARLPQLPLGQKITLARRGSARVAGALLIEGHAQIVSVVLDNPNLNEAQILRALSRDRLPAAVVSAVAHHRKWSLSYNVRVALLRHPASALVTVLAILPQLTVSDLKELASPGIVSENLRKYLQAEVARRLEHGPSKKPRK